MLTLRFRLSTLLLCMLHFATSSANDDVIFAESFEGFALLGGTIAGQAFFDPDSNGVLADGEPLSGAEVYLDVNFNGRFDHGEPLDRTDEEGRYRFAGVGAGVWHVRQVLPAPNLQTFPSGGVPPVYDRLPDEVVEYVHAAPGLGNFDVPYGRNASDYPPNWGGGAQNDNAQIVDSVNLVLKPIGVRDRSFGSGPTNGTEVLTLPQGASILVRFDEPIYDGPGIDLVLYSYGGAAALEQAAVNVGASVDALSAVGVFNQGDGSFPIDLADFGILGTIHYLEVAGLDLLGSWFGFEFVGAEAFNVAAADPDAHIVTVTPDEFVFEDLDFGRFARDLPPNLTLGIEDNVPATPELRAGESIRLQAYAQDDLGITSLTVTANGAVVNLDENDAVDIDLLLPGLLLIDAETTDTAGQTTARQLQIYVMNPDGSVPFDPNAAGQSNQSAATAPRPRILTPAPGMSASGDIDIIGQVLGDPAPTAWTLEYAQVDLIDPYDLPADDPDYIEIGSGTGPVASDLLGIAPLSSEPDGIYFIRLTAENNLGQFAWFGQVLAKNVSPSALRPVIAIDSPVPEAAVAVTVDIEGTIESGRPLVDWFVEYASIEQVDLNNVASNAPDWTRIAEGTDAVSVPGLLANFDATVLRNGRYVVRIVARNDIGLGRVEALVLDVIGNAKIGRNRLEFDDIQLELAGFPIQMTRIYDSLRADQSGDLGFGWSLGLVDADIGETVPDTGVLGLFGSTPFRVGTRVYLDAPTGERLAFTFDPQPGPPGPFGQSYFATFDADPGNYHRLEVPQGDQAFLRLNSDGTVGLLSIGFPWNPEQYVLVAPDGRRYFVHEDQGLLAAEDLNGNRISINDNGIDHSNGPGLEFIRDAQGRIVEVRDPDGNTWRYAYDAAGDLVSFEDPDGNQTIYVYRSDPAHYLESISDPQGRMPRRYEYDPDSGRLTAVIDENGNRRESLYDPQGFIGFETDARGNVSEIQYNERGNVTQLLDPKGNLTRYEYADPDNPDRETLLIDPSGEPWRYAYDEMGRPVDLASPLATLANQRITISYDEFGNVTEFNDYDRRISTFTYDDRGNRLSESPFDGIQSDFVYNADGRRIQRARGNSDLTEYIYDANGYLQLQTDSTGNQIQYERTATGRVTRFTDANAPLDIDYTAAGILATQHDASGNTVQFVENADGSLTRTDRLGGLTQVASDADDRPTHTHLPGGGTVTLTYDPDGNPQTVTDPLGNTTTYQWDSTNVQVGYIDPAGAAETRTVDENGNVIELIDRNGKRRTFEWDANRRIRFERWHDGDGAVVREIEWIYNATRGLERIEDRFGGETYTLDYSGRQPRPGQVDYSLPGQVPWRVTYNWNNQAEFPVLVQVSGDGSVANRIVVEEYAGRNWGMDWQHPDGGGNTIRLVRRPDGTIGRIERKTGLGGGSTPDAISFRSYDALGRIASIRHEDANGLLLHPNAELLYQRNAGEQIVVEQHVSNAVTYTYDNDRQLTAATHDNPTYPDESYGYDIAGNRISSHLAPGTASVGSGNRITTAGNFDYQYDAAGNLARRTNTSSGEVVEFEYDHRNRLILASVHPSLGTPASAEVEMAYDYRDRLLYRVIDNQKTWFIHDRDHLVAEFADGASQPSAVYLYDPSTLDQIYAAWRADGLGERWYLRDALGSIRGITDQHFQALSWVDYDAFGNLQPGSVPIKDDPLRFAARPFLAPIGLYDNRRRFLDPRLGRFTQEDPVRHAGQDFNLYRYAFNQPMSFTDPTGEVAAIELEVVMTIVDVVFQAIDTGANNPLGQPCSIAFATAAGFAWFDVVAAIVSEPRDPTPPPNIGPDALLLEAGFDECFSGYNPVSYEDVFGD
ncbi:MAG: RHS repeat-associated core domain-containing protein [Pseudomonadota bacterium]